MTLEEFWILEDYLYCSFVVDEAHAKTSWNFLMERNNFEDIVLGFDFLFSIPYYIES
jgi:hypothetical protein